MKLIKGPFLIKVNDHVLDNVTKIIYAKGQLGIDVLVTDYEMANLLLEKTPINRVYCIGCSENPVGATYYTKKYETGIILDDNKVMKLRVIFDVWRAKIGEITE